MTYAIKKCFLCGSESKQSETDHENRYLVTCLGIGCGKYEITKSLVDELDDISGLQSKFQELVNAKKKYDGYYDFMRDSNGQINCNWIPRR